MALLRICRLGFDNKRLHKPKYSPCSILFFFTVFHPPYVKSYTPQIFRLGYHTSISSFLQGWANSLLNWSDIIVIGLYFIALGLRLHQKTMDVGHLIYAIDVGLWWLRILPMLLISPTLGPYLVMITLMLKDLMMFLCMLLIFIVCYGVVSTAILDPHEAGTL